MKNHIYYEEKLTVKHKKKNQKAVSKYIKKYI